jgi:hypothetical protein
VDFSSFAQSLQRAASSLPIGCSDLVVFQEGAQCNEEESSREDLCVAEGVEGEVEIGRLPPPNTYSPSSGGRSGYSN